MKKTNGGTMIKASAIPITLIGALYWAFLTLAKSRIIIEFLTELPIILIASILFCFVLYGLGEYIDSMCKIKEALFSIAKQNKNDQY